MTEKLNEFMSRLEVVGSAPPEAAAQAAEQNDETVRRLERLEKRINSLVLSSAAKRRPVPGSLMPARRMPSAQPSF